jgi:hypothetical protein
VHHGHTTGTWISSRFTCFLILERHLTNNMHKSIELEASCIRHYTFSFLNEHIVISQTHEFDHVPNKHSETPISDQS